MIRASNAFNAINAFPLTVVFCRTTLVTTIGLNALIALIPLTEDRTGRGGCP